MGFPSPQFKLIGGSQQYHYWATFNSRNKPTIGSLSNGMLTCASASSAGQYVSTIGMTLNLAYCEFSINSVGAGNLAMFGICDASASQGVPFGSTTDSYSIEYIIASSGLYTRNGGGYTSFSPSTSFIASDVVSLAYDGVNKYLYCALNGAWLNGASVAGIASGTGTGAAFSGLSGTLYFAASNGAGTTYSYTVNFGSAAWLYPGSVPSGYAGLHH
jgi:hypothetical protein